MRIGIDDNADRDMEWCGAVIEFTPAGNANPRTHLCSACHPQVLSFLKFPCIYKQISHVSVIGLFYFVFSMWTVTRHPFK